MTIACKKIASRAKIMPMIKPIRIASHSGPREKRVASWMPVTNPAAPTNSQKSLRPATSKALPRIRLITLSILTSSKRWSFYTTQTLKFVNSFCTISRTRVQVPGGKWYLTSHGGGWASIIFLHPHQDNLSQGPDDEQARAHQNFS